MSWFNKKKERTWRFEPQKDITAYELALVVKILLRTKAITRIDQNNPEEFKRHFVERENV